MSGRRIATVALTVGMVASLATAAAANDHAAITSPSVGEVVHTNTLDLAAHDEDATTGDVNWAVRDQCAPGGTNFAGGGPNVDADDEREWSDGQFTASIDVTGWEAGQYCFIFNPTDTPTRLSTEFYLVDDFAQVGGTIGMGQAGRGNSPTHVVSGLVGDAGDAGIVGSITVNYRELGEVVTRDAASLFLRDAAVADDPTADVVAEIEATDGAMIFLLDRDATDEYPRGGVIVRTEGGPTDNPQEIDATPGVTGADSWVALERGNVHVGSR